MDVNGCEWLMMIVNGYSWQLVGKTLVKRLGYWQIGRRCEEMAVWNAMLSWNQQPVYGKIWKITILMGKSTMAIWKIANC